MAQQTLPYGQSDNDPNPANSLPIREAWKRTGEMFSDLYSLQSSITSAGDFAFAGELTDEEKIDAAIASAMTDGDDIVFIPANLLPYDVTLLTNLAAFTAAGGRLVREGGDFSVYDVQAYGADALGVLDAGPAWNAARGALPAPGGPLRVSFGTYTLTTAFTFAAQTNVTLQIDHGTVLTGNALPTPAVGSNNTILDYRAGINHTGAIQVVGPANLPLASTNVPFVRMSVGGGDFLGVNEVAGQANVWSVAIGDDTNATGTLVLRRARAGPSELLQDNASGVIKFGGYRGDPGGGASPWVTAATIQMHAHANWSTSSNHSYLLFSLTNVTTVQSAMELRTTGNANEMYMRLYDFSAGALVRLSRGATDSGGVGFRVLRVPN